MPIQNVGTLIENLVVTEASALLFEQLESGQELGFATAFAMPTLSEWRPHPQAIGISSQALGKVAGTTIRTPFLDAMSRCLRHRPSCGPNAALLVGLVAASKGKGLRLWLNDITDGHYGNALPSLGQIGALLKEMVPEYKHSLQPSVCEVPYPSSLQHLSRALIEWRGSVGPVLGFLDPMRYRLDAAPGAYTHSRDHRHWLTILRELGSSLAIHFTGDSDHRTLREELSALREDLRQSGFPYWLEIQRQHYVVSTASSDAALLDQLESRALTSWKAWCECVGEVKSTDLGVLRS